MTFNIDWEGTGLWHIALAVGVIAWAWALLHILTTRYTPAGTSAWLLAIVLIPYVGVPLYAVFGGRKLRKIIRRKAHIQLPADTVVDLEATGEIDRLLRGLKMPGATCGNRLTLHRDGVESWTAIVDLVAKAQQSIDLLVYVFQKDSVGRLLVQHLAEKARAGVAVRVLYDSIGSHATSRRLFEPLCEAGGVVQAFMPASWWPFRSRTNLRNHRKLMVVDQKIAWAGGMNIGEEYLGPRSDPDRWLDLSFTIEGPAVQAFGEMFRFDWAFARNEHRGPPAPPVPPVFGDDGIVQIVPSGPDVDHDPLYAALVSMAFLAKERLWIVTPYYVPNDVLNDALCLAARRGVDLRIFLPRRSNHRLPDVARAPFLRDVERAGGKVHLSRRMLHAKVVVMDDALAVHGSANVDFRSLFLNFEVATLCYSRRDVDAARLWIESVMPQSLPHPQAISFGARLTEGAMRLVAPLL